MQQKLNILFLLELHRCNTGVNVSTLGGGGAVQGEHSTQRRGTELISCVFTRGWKSSALLLHRLQLPTEILTSLY